MALDIGAVTRSITDSVANITANVSDLNEQLGSLPGAIAGAGGPSGSEGGSDAFLEIQDMIKSLSGGGQEGAPQAGGPNGSSGAAPADAEGGEGKNAIAEILGLILQKLQSGELKPDEAGKLLEQLGKLLQAPGGQGATGEGLPQVPAS